MKTTVAIEPGLYSLIERGVNIGASDIHIEPRAEHIVIRYRVGNSLINDALLSIDDLEPLLRSARNMARLDQHKSGQLQEGEFEVMVSHQPHTIQLSMIPLVEGEKMVLHINTTSVQSLSLEELGYWGKNYQNIHQALTRMRGLIIVASTDRHSSDWTLMSLTRDLQHPSIRLASISSSPHNNATIKNIVVEQRIGLTPERSFNISLRTNPAAVFIHHPMNIGVMKLIVTETKHRMVCTSMLFPDAATTLYRLSKAPLDSAALSQNLKVIVSQTLVRRLCVHCRELYRPSVKVKEAITKIAHPFTDKQIHEYEKNAKEAGLGAEISDLQSTSTYIVKLWRAREGGCEYCNFTGYHLFTTINEVLDTSHPAVQHCIQEHSQKSRIKETCLLSGMVPKQIDGLVKCLRGIIGIDDVLAADHAPGSVVA